MIIKVCQNPDFTVRKDLSVIYLKNINKIKILEDNKGFFLKKALNIYMINYDQL